MINKLNMINKLTIVKTLLAIIVMAILLCFGVAINYVPNAHAGTLHNTIILGCIDTVLCTTAILLTIVIWSMPDV
jgi:hypothetical protein